MESLVYRNAVESGSIPLGSLIGSYGTQDVFVTKTKSKSDTIMRKREDAIMEITPVEVDKYETALYAIRQDWDGSLYVDIIDSAALTEFQRNGKMEHNKGTFFWRNIPEEVEEELYLERRVDVDPFELESYVIATDDGDSRE